MASTVTKGISAVHAPNVLWADGIGAVLNGFGDLDLGITATLREHLETVISGRVVGGGHRHTVGTAEVPNGPHDHRGRSRPVDDSHDDVVTGEYLRCPPSEFRGKEALVVSDDDRAMFLIFVVYTVGKRLSDPLNI